MSKTDAIAANDDVVPDFNGVTNFADIQSRFIKAARSIMFEHKLVFGSKRFEISSLELYLKLHNQPHIWWDPATDKGVGAEEQFNRATWYVRQKKGPRYQRIDITAGCRLSGIQAGLLIRALNRDDGPAKALHAIIRDHFSPHRWNSKEQERIEEIHGKGIDGANGSPLKMLRRKTPLQGSYYTGIRINIPKRHRNKKFEDVLIGTAPLRIATWKMKPLDEEHAQ